MHVAYLSASALALAFWPDVWRPSLGRSCRQACRAARNTGDWGLELGSFGLPDQLGRPFDPIVGSGKPLTPWLRMQTENLTAFASKAADATGLEQPEGEQPEFDESDEATEDAPPHAAKPIPRAMRVASSAADGRLLLSV